MNLQQRDLKTIWHPFTQMKTAKSPIVITKGKGEYIYDEEGNEYLDAISSWWVNIHGHAHPYIAKQIAIQANELEQVIFAGFTHPKAIELAEKLLGFLPDEQSKIFYTDNGSTAVEVALKMAIQYWYNMGDKKHTIIAFKGSYHGDTFGAMSASDRGDFNKPFWPNLFDVHYIDVPVEGKEKTVLLQLKETINLCNPAAFIFEPLVLGAGGMMMYAPEVLDQLLKICKDSGVLTIADEVMTGFGRTGRFFATDYVMNKPDIYCMSKGITGGFLPLGATSCTQNIYDAFYDDDKMKALYHGHSYTANPLACAAAIASLEVFEKENRFSDLERISQSHAEFIKEIQHCKKITAIRQQGTIIAMNIDDGSNYFSSIRDKVYRFFINRKILLRPLGNVLYILPPYCITSENLGVIYEAIKELDAYLVSDDSVS